MRHFTLEEKFNIIKEVADGNYIGIQNFGMLHEIASALDMKNNTGIHLHTISYRINDIMRQLKAAGYPVKEYRIKCCSWSEKETWHPMFKIEESENNK